MEICTKLLEKSIIFRLPLGYLHEVQKRISLPTILSPDYCSESFQRIRIWLPWNQWIIRIYSLVSLETNKDNQHSVSGIEWLCNFLSNLILDFPCNLGFIPRFNILCLVDTQGKTVRNIVWNYIFEHFLLSTNYCSFLEAKSFKSIL